MGNGSILGAAGIRTSYLAQSPMAVLVPTIAATALGGLMLWSATELSAPSLGLAGLVVTTGAAWIATDYSAGKWRTLGNLGWRTFVVVAALLGLVAVVVANVVRSPVLALIGLMSLNLGIAPFVGEIRDADAADAERRMEAGLVMGLVSAVFVGSSVPNFVRLIAFIILLAGFGLFTGGLSTLCAHGALPRSRLLRVIPGDARQRGLIVGAVGLAILLFGFTFLSWPVVAVGAWLTILGMISLSVSPARFELSASMQTAILAAGVGLVVVAGYQIYVTSGSSAWVVSFIVIALALAGAWIVWRGATLFIGWGLGFIFVWGMFSHTTLDPHHVSTVADGGDASTAGVVALGDSFISGEGAAEFYAGTNQNSPDQNECRRAPTAYPVLLSIDTNGDSNDGERLTASLSSAGLDFVACSRATLRNVLELTSDDAASDTTIDATSGDVSEFEKLETEGGERVNPRSILECDVPLDQSIGQFPCGPDGVYGSHLQIDHLAANRDATELVLISIGGSDVNFGDIVATCLLPGSCAERGEDWLDNVAALGPELSEAYTMVRNEFPKDVPVVVMPYPLVLTQDTCDGSPLDAGEHEFVFKFTTILNRQISVAASQAGVHFFEEGAFALEGHRLCESGIRAINLVQFQPIDGSLFQRLDPGSWSHNSMYPNPRGHRMIAEQLGAWLDTQEIVGSGNPEPAATSPAPSLGVPPARPFAVAPSVVDALRSSAERDCGFADFDSFATQIAVFDEQLRDTTAAEVFRVPVAGADTATTVCVTDSTGAWKVLTPTVDESGHPPTARLPSAEPIAEVVDDRLFVTGGRPDKRCLTEQDEQLCDFQWILFTAASESSDTAVSERSWNLLAVQYCSTDPDCEDTFGQWTASQIRQAGLSVGPTIGLSFLGGWMLALWTALRAPRFAPMFPDAVLAQLDPIRVDAIRSEIPDASVDQTVNDLRSAEDAPVPSSKFAFIAYAREDAEGYVEQLAKFLEAKNIPVWYDRRLEVGDEWLKVILERVRQSSAFLIVSTPSAGESSWVEMEFITAMDAKLKLFPILLTGEPLDFLKIYQMEDLRKRRDLSTRFVETLQKQLAKEQETRQ